MARSDEPANPRAKNNGSRPFSRFETLAKRLVRVPKKEIREADRRKKRSA